MLAQIMDFVFHFYVSFFIETPSGREHRQRALFLILQSRGMGIFYPVSMETSTYMGNLYTFGESKKIVFLADSNTYILYSMGYES
jgi:hypothetical protein